MMAPSLVVWCVGGVDGGGGVGGLVGLVGLVCWWCVAWGRCPLWLVWSGVGVLVSRDVCCLGPMPPWWFGVLVCWWFGVWW